MEWHAGEIPLIELAALYGWLPDESATKTAQAGDREDRRWGEREHMQALLLAYQQIMIRLMWAGFRIEGRAPDLGKLDTPTYRKAREEAEKEEAEQQQYLARVAQLRKYSPTYQREAG